MRIAGLHLTRVLHYFSIAFFALLLAGPFQEELNAQGFSAIISNNAAPGSGPEGIADVDRNGSPDLLCRISLNASTYLIALTNDGAGNFASNSIFLINNGKPFVADFNQDSVADVGVLNVGGPLLVKTNDGRGEFINASILSLPSMANQSWAFAIDINGDGYQDVVAGSLTAFGVTTNNQNGGYTAGYSKTFPFQVFEVVAGDLTGDGVPELIGAGNRNLFVLTNSGTGDLALQSTNVTHTTWPGNLCVADCNQDGKLDVVVPAFESNGGRSFVVFTNAGSGVIFSNGLFSIPTQKSFQVGLNQLFTSDFNGDGAVDLFWAGTFYQTVFTNDGSGVFEIADIAGLNRGQIISAGLADFNSDGKPDLLTRPISPNALMTFINGTPFPTATTSPPLGIKKIGGMVSVSWPSDSPGWSLQKSQQPDAATWGQAELDGYTPVNDGIQTKLVVPAVFGEMYFRMQHP